MTHYTHVTTIKTSNLHLLFSWGLVMFTFFSCLAQNGDFTSLLEYRISEQFPIIPNQVYDLVELSDGSIMVGTDDGVFHVYNRDNIINYTTHDGLPDNTIFKLYLGPSGKVWALTYRGGVAYYENNQWNIPPSNDKLKSELVVNFPYSAYEIEDGYLLVSSLRKDTHTYIIGVENDSLEKHFIPATTKSEWACSYVLIDPNNREVMVRGLNRPSRRSTRGTGNDDHLTDTTYTIRNKEYQLLLIEDSYPTLAKFQPIRSHTIYWKDDYLFITHLSNLYLYHPKEGMRLLTTVDADDIQCITILDHVLFVGTNGGGLNRYRIEGDGSITLIDNQFPQQTITDVIRDGDGRYWIANLNQGVFIVNDFEAREYLLPQGLASTRTGRPYNIINDRALVLREDSLFSFPLGNDKQLHLGQAYSFLDSVPIHYSKLRWDGTSAYVKALRIDMESLPPKATLWGPFSIQNPNKYSIYRFIPNDRPNGYELALARERVFAVRNESATELLPQASIKNFIYDAIPIADDRFLIGSHDGLFTWRIGEDSLSPISPDDYLARLPNRRVFEMKNGLFISLVANEGILLFNESQVRHIPSDTIALGEGVKDIEVLENCIYGMTDQSYFCISFQENGAYQIKKIPSEELGGAQMYDDILINGGENLILSKEDAILKIPTSLFSFVPPPISIQFESVQVNGLVQSLTTGNYVELERGESKLDFQFSTKRNLHIGKVVYAFKYDDNPWEYNTTGTYSLHSQRVGKHQLQVKAQSDAGAWTEEAVTYSFTVRKPILQTSWFWILAISPFILISIYSIWENFRRRRLEQSLLESNITSLKMQINPHFIFNSFNSIQYLISTNRNDSAQQYLSQFAHLIRKIISRPDLHRISLSEELTYINEYMELEKLRLENQLNFSIEISPDINPDHTLIPPMLLQPILENSVWHGVSTNQERESIIQVKIERGSSGSIVIHIIDNGSGFPQQKWKQLQSSDSTSRSLGLRNVLSRLSILSQIEDQKYYLELKESEVGTHFVLTLAS